MSEPVEGAALGPVSVALPWQMDVWSSLLQQLEDQRLPHALLLCGPQFVGKRRFAMALARRLLCHSPVAGSNCGECHACQLTRAGTHGDLRWVEPQEKSRVIKVDQTRDVVEFAAKTATLGQRKVVVFEPAEAMNVNAANALLKCLEEPAPDTYLLLLCHRPQRLLPTIRSRCQVANLPQPDAEQALGWLDQLSGSRERSEQLWSLAEAQPLLAEHLLSDPDQEALAALPQLLAQVLAGQRAASEFVMASAELTLEEVVGRMIEGLQRYLKQLDATALRGTVGQGAFAALEYCTGQLRIIESGANPNRELYVDNLLIHSLSLLGSRD